MVLVKPATDKRDNRHGITPLIHVSVTANLLVFCLRAKLVQIHSRLKFISFASFIQNSFILFRGKFGQVFTSFFTLSKKRRTVLLILHSICAYIFNLVRRLWWSWDAWLNLTKVDILLRCRWIHSLKLRSCPLDTRSRHVNSRITTICQDAWERKLYFNTKSQEKDRFCF